MKETGIDIPHCYKMLGLSPRCSNEQITSSYKKLARKYHPDLNRSNPEWANNAMTALNLAYSTLMSYRFENPLPSDSASDTSSAAAEAKTAHRSPEKKPEQKRPNRTYDDDFFISRFVKYRESAKEAMYKYFQYALYNMARRDEVRNRGTFNSMVKSLRRSYHGISELAKLTDDTELLQHFSVFTSLIFNFYRSSECLNVNDSYADQFEVDAYRSYRMGDDALHMSIKELFYDRHNRGFMKRELAVSNLQKAETIFRMTMKNFRGSTWIVETGIKLEFCASLKDYIQLFFSE